MRVLWMVDHVTQKLDQLANAVGHFRRTFVRANRVVHNAIIQDFVGLANRRVCVCAHFPAGNTVCAAPEPELDESDDCTSSGTVSNAVSDFQRLQDDVCLCEDHWCRGPLGQGGGDVVVTPAL